MGGLLVYFICTIYNAAVHAVIVWSDVQQTHALSCHSSNKVSSAGIYDDLLA